jgi:hypothetical protein
MRIIIFILLSCMFEYVVDSETTSSDEHVFVTAFYDIGRGMWPHKYSRSTETYLSRFSLLVQLNLPLIVFIDERYADAVEEIVNANSATVGKRQRIDIVRIDDHFLTSFVASWNYIDIENDIMSSDDYIALSRTRSEAETPETRYASYNCINHAKIDFVMLGIQYYKDIGLQIGYAGWVDFGYVTEQFEVVPFSLNKNLLYNGKMNFLSHGGFTDQEMNPVYVFANVPIKVGGAFWFGSIDSVMEYRELYHTCVNEMHSQNLADDDQTVDICCYFKKKQIFKMWNNDIWAVINDVPQVLWFLAFVLFNENFVDEPVVGKFLSDNSITSSNQQEVYG